MGKFIDLPEETADTKVEPTKAAIKEAPPQKGLIDTSSLKEVSSAEPGIKEALAGSVGLDSYIGGKPGFGNAVTPEGFGRSKYDRDIRFISPDYDLNEFRGQFQTAPDKLGNALVKLTTGTATATVGNLTGVFYGLGKAVKTGELSSIYRNGIFEGLDRIDQDMQERFPHYYTQKEAELGFGSIGTLNFWADQMVGGMSFMAGAVLTELAITAATGGIGSIPAMSALSARMTGKMAAMSRLRNLSRASNLGTASKAALGVAEGAGTLAKGFWEGGKLTRQLITGAGYEAAVESMHAYDSMSERLMDERFADRFQGQNLTREQKRQLLTPDEQKRIHSEVVDATNMIFAGNMVLVGTANMVNLATLYRPKWIKDISKKAFGDGVHRDALKGAIGKGGALGKAGKFFKPGSDISLGAKGLERTRTVGSWLGRGLSEAGQEIGQGILGRWGDEYALSVALGYEGVDLMDSFIDHAKGELGSITDGTASADLVKEGMLGALVSMIGLPGTGMLMTNDLAYARRNTALNQAKDSITADNMARYKKMMEDDPSFMSATRQLLTLVNSRLARTEMAEAATKEGDAFTAKNLDEDNLFDYIHYRLETGSFDDLKKEIEEIDSMTDAEFKEEFKMQDATSEQVSKRRGELKEKTTRLSEAIVEATEKVDAILDLTPTERYLSTQDPNSKAFQRRILIRALTQSAESEKRENDLIEQISEATGGKIDKVTDKVDTITLNVGGKEVSMNLGEMPGGEGVTGVLNNTVTRLAMLQSIPKGERTAGIELEVQKLSQLKESLEEMLKEKSPKEIAGDMTSEQEDRILAQWMDSDPITSLLENDIRQKIKDVRKLRVRRQEAIETFQAMLDPEMRKAKTAAYTRVQKAIIEKAVEAAEKAAAEDKSKEAIKDFKKKIEGYRKYVTDSAQSLSDRMDKASERLETATADHLKLIEAYAKLDRKNLKTTTIEIAGEKLKVSRKQLLEWIELAEKDLDAAKNFRAETEAEFKKVAEDFAEMLKVLDQLEKQDPEKARAIFETELAKDPFTEEEIKSSTWLQSLYEDAPDPITGTTILRPISGNYLRNLSIDRTEKEKELLDTIIQDTEEKLEALKELLTVAKAASELPIEERKFNVEKEELDGIIAAIAQTEADLEAQKLRRNQLEKYGEFTTSYRAMRMLEMLSRLDSFNPKEEEDIDTAQAMEDAVAELDAKDTAPMRKKLLDDIISTSVLFKDHADIDGTGALNTYLRLQPIKERTPEQEKQFKIAESQLVFNHWIGSGIDIKDATQGHVDNSSYSKDKVYGTGMLYVHRGNINAIEDVELRKELEQLLWIDPEADRDTEDIKAFVVNVETSKGNQEVHLLRNPDGVPIVASMATTRMTMNSKEGTEESRYAVKDGDSVEEKQQALRTFRNHILDSKELMITAISKKSPGAIKTDKADKAPKEVIKAELTAIPLWVIKPTTKIVEEPEIEEKDGVHVRKTKHGKYVSKDTKDRKKREKGVISDFLKGGKMSIRSSVGQIWAFDTKTELPVPMRPTFHTKESAENVAALFAYQLSKYNSVVKDGQTPGTARTAVKEAVIEYGGHKINVYNLTEDLVDTRNSEDNYHLHMNLWGKEAFITFGPGKLAVTLEDIQTDTARGKEFIAFLQTKFRHVNPKTVKEAVGHGKQDFGTKYVAKRKWVHMTMNRATLSPTSVEEFQNYNHFLLTGTKKGGSPLISRAVSHRATIMEPRSEGGYLVAKSEHGNKPITPVAVRLSKERSAKGATEKGPDAATSEKADKAASAQEKQERAVQEKAEFVPSEEMLRTSHKASDFSALSKLSGEKTEPVTEDDSSASAMMKAAKERVAVQVSGDYTVRVHSFDPEAKKATTKELKVNRRDMISEFTEDAGVVLSTTLDGKRTTLIHLSKDGELVEFFDGVAEIDALFNDAKEILDQKPFMTVTEEPAQEPSERQKEIAAVQGMTPMDVQMVEGYLKSMDGHAVGRLVDFGKALLSDLAPAGTIFHEAFHNIELYILSKADLAHMNRLVRSRPGETVTYKGEQKPFSALTDKEVSEWRAEEFRKTTLDPSRPIGHEDIDTRTVLQKLFDFIRNLIKTLLRLDGNFQYSKDARTLDDLFKDVRTGRFKMSPRAHNAVQVADMILFPGMTETYTRDAVSFGMTMFGSAIDEINGKIREAILNKAPWPNGFPEKWKSGKLLTMYDVGRMYISGSSEEKAYLKRVRDYVVLENEAKEIQDQGVKDLLLKLRSTNSAIFEKELIARIENILSVKLNKKDAKDEEVDESEAKEDGGKQWDVIEGETSVLSKVPPMLKFLLSTLPGKKNSTGAQGAVSLPEVLQTLQKELAGQESLDAKFQRLLEISDRYPWAETLAHRLGVDWNHDNEVQPTTDMLRVQMQVDFSTYFNSHYTVPRTLMVNSSEDSSAVIAYVQKADEEAQNKNIRRAWRTNLIRTGQSLGYLKVNNGKFSFDVDHRFTISKLGTTSIRDISKQLTNADYLKGEKLYAVASLIGAEFSDISAVEEKVSVIRDSVASIIQSIVKSPGNILLYDRNQTDEVGNFNKLVDLERRTSKENREATVVGPNGKLQFMFQRRNLIGLMSTFAKELNGHFDESRNPWTGGSVLKSRLIDGEIDTVEVLGLDTETKEPGNKLPKLTEVDMSLTYIGMLMNDIFLSPRAADQGTEMGFKVRGESFNEIVGKRNSTERDDVILGYIKAEAMTAITNGGKEFIAGFAENGRNLRFFKSVLLSTDILKAKDETGVDEYIQDPENRKALSEAVKAAFKVENDEFKAQLVSLGLLTRTEDGEYLSKIPKTLFAENAPDSDLWAEMSVDNFVDELNFRQFVSNVEFFKLFAGDPVQYMGKDGSSSVLKRVKMMMGGRTSMVMDPSLVESVQTTSAETVPLFNEDGELDYVNGKKGKVLLVHDPKTNVPVEMHQELLELSELAAKSYKENNGDVADGTLIVDLNAYRMMQALSGLWTPEKDAAYERLRGRAEAALTGSLDSKYEREMRQRAWNEGESFVVDKFIYVGPTAYKKDMSILGMSGIKMSVVPIWEDLGVIGDKEFPNIKHTLEFLRKNDAIALTFPSAAKFGSTREDGATDSGYGDGKMEFSYPADVTEKGYYFIDMRFFSSQVKVSPYKKNKVGTPVQLRSHAEADLYENGELYVQSGEDPAEATARVTEVQELTARYAQVSEAMAVKAYKKFIKKLGLTDTGMLHEQDPARLNSLVEFLEGELGEDVDERATYLSFLKYKETLPEGGQFHFEAVIDSRKLFEILYAEAKNKIIKKKVRGDMLVQQSSFGYEVSRPEGTTVEAVPDKLGFYIDKDADGKQRIRMQVYLPHYLKELIPLGQILIGEDGALILRTDGKDRVIQDAATARETFASIGVRIPLDGIHSIELMEVKGFLPAEAGPRIIVPDLIVIKAGSDFDIDKLTCLFKSMFVDKDNLKIKLHTFESAEDHYRRKVEPLRKLLDENGILNTDFLGGKELSAHLNEAGTPEGSPLRGLLDALLGTMIDEEYESKEDVENTLIEKGVIADDKLRLLRYMNEDGTIKSFEQWNAERRLEGITHDLEHNSEGALENEFMDIVHKLVSMPNRRKTFLEPVNIEHVKAVATEVADKYRDTGNTLIPELDKVTDWFKQLSLRARITVTKAYLDAKQTVGIYALHATHHIKAQKAGLKVNPDLQYKIRTGNQELTIPMRLNFTSMVGWPMLLGHVLDAEGNKITGTISELVNAAVDMVNKPQLHKLNFGQQTAPTVAALVRLGVPVRSVAYLMNQQIIREWLAERQIHNSIVYKTLDPKSSEERETEAVTNRTLLDRYAAVVKGDIPPNIPLSDEELHEMMGYTLETVPEKDKTRFAILQYHALKDFLVYREFANDLSDLMNGQSFDTKVSRSLAESKLRVARYQSVLSAEHRPFLNGADVVTGGARGSFMAPLTTTAHRISNAFDSFSALIGNYDSKMGMLYHQLVQAMGGDRKKNVDDQISALQRVEQVFMTILLQQTLYKDQSGIERKIVDDRDRLMYGDNNQKHRVLKLSQDKLGKDQGKANYANAVIALPVKGRKSSTEGYMNDAEAQGFPVNEFIPMDPGTVAFVSVASEGTRVKETVAIAKRLISAGGTVVMDQSGTGKGQSHSTWNKKGEGAVQEALGIPSGKTKEGYNYWGPSPEKATATGYADSNPKTKKFEGQMTFSYRNDKREDVKASTTFDAILNGERTATTRYKSEGKLDYWKKAKVGDIITWESADGRTVDVVVTKAASPLKGSGKTPEQWSKLEGWSVKYFQRKVLPKLDEAWQIEYKLVPARSEAAVKISGKDIASKVQAIQNDPEHPLNDNLWIGAVLPILSHEVGNIGDMNNYLQAAKRSTVSEEKVYLLDAFQEIQDHDPELARDLIHAAMLQAGTTMSPYTLMNIVPGPVYTEIAAQVLQKYAKEGLPQPMDEVALLTLLAVNMLHSPGFASRGTRRKRDVYMPVHQAWKKNRKTNEWDVEISIERNHMENMDWSKPMEGSWFKVDPELVRSHGRVPSLLNTDMIKVEFVETGGDKKVILCG